MFVHLILHSRDYTLHVVEGLLSVNLYLDTLLNPEQCWQLERFHLQYVKW